MKKLLSWILLFAILLTAGGCGSLEIPTKEASPGRETASPQESPAAASSGQETAAPETKPYEGPAVIPGEKVRIYNDVLSQYEAEAPRQTLVQDTELYAAMVHGRYFDLWDRRSLYFTEPELYSFEKVLKHIQEDNAAAAWVADHIGAPLLHQTPNAENYIRLLLMLIVMQADSFSQAGKTMSDYDTLKAFPDYVEDFVDIGLDVVNLTDLNTVEDLGFSLFGAGKDIAKLSIGSLAEYEMYKDAASNYNNAYLLLDTIRSNTGDKELLKAVDKILPLITEARNRIFGGDIGDYMADVTASVMGKSGLFINTLIAFMEESAELEPFAREALPFVKKLKDAMDLKFIPGFSTAKIAFKSVILAGDMIFGTTNTYNRYAEMRCLSEIASALRASLSSGGYVPAFEKGSIARAERAVPLMQFYLLTCLRGEYCAEELVVNDGGVLSGSLGTGDKPSREEIQAWFDAKNEILSDIYGDVSRILCTGNEVYYRYLEDEIIPEYGWAKTGTLEWEVKDLSSSRYGNMADGVAAYKDPDTGETGTGVVSAIVKDFDADGVNDMLVLFLDTAPIEETALSVVYKNASALVLKARLYTMQYNARPDGEESVKTAAGPLNEPGRIPSIRQFFLDNISRWIEVNAQDWRMIDRYTVYETDSIDLAGEFYGLGYGSLKAGLYVLDDTLYFYTSEHMDDYTTYGPGVSRTWHVEEGRFIFDNASRSVGWGQGSFKINLGDNGTDFGPTTGSVENGILLDLSVSIIRYFNPGPPAFQTVLKDRTYIRKVLEEGEGELHSLRGDDPVKTRVETILNPHQDAAKALVRQIADESGVGMSLSGERNETNGTYWVTYTSAKNTSLTVNIDLNGTVTAVSVTGKLSEQHGEWQTVKDAMLRTPQLALPESVVSHFIGDCGRSDRMDLDWGYVLLGNMDNIFIRILWE